MFVKGLITFAAGLVGFLSPCVLPLLPGYVGFMTGASAGEKVPVRKALPGTLAFVGGLTVVFVSLGATASVLSEFLRDHKRGIELIGGAFIVVLGLLMVFGDRFAFFLRERRFQMRPKAGVVPTFLLGAAFAFGWTPCIGPTLGAALNLAATSDGLASGIGLLYSEKRMQTSAKPAGFFGAMLVGIAFAFGWTPCIGPILAAILAVAATQESVGEGVKLLAVYSAGLGVPFVATSLAINKFFAASARIRKHYHTIEVVSGVLLVVVGVLIFTNRFTIIAQLLTPYLPTY